MNAKLWNRLAAALMLGSFILISGVGTEGCKPKVKKAFGVDCTEETDCESGICTEFGNVCSKTCTYDKDCGTDLVCRAVTDKESECAKAVDQPVGGQCDNGAKCSNGLCLHEVGKESQPGICSKYCQTQGDCPAGYKNCMSISDSGLVKVCLPGAGKKFGKPAHGGRKGKGKGKGNQGNQGNQKPQ